MERFKSLEQSERDLISAMNFLGQALQELSKDKPTAKAAEQCSTHFVNYMQAVETNISNQISYLSQAATGREHEGSAYGSQKVLDMARHRMEHSRSRLKELERQRLIQWQEVRMSQPQQPPQPPPPPAYKSEPLDFGDSQDVVQILDEINHY